MSKLWLDRVVFYNSTSRLRPRVVAGPTTSGLSAVAAQLGASATLAENPFGAQDKDAKLNIEGVLTMSASSTSAELDLADLFARTIPTNRGDALALCLYLSSIGTHQLAVLYVNDAYGKSYMLNLMSAAGKYGITLHLLPFDIAVAGGLDDAIDQLRASDVRYVFGVVYDSDWQASVRAMYDAKLMGNPDCAWFWSDSMNRLTVSSVGLIEQDIARAINGSAVVSIMPPS